MKNKQAIIFDLDGTLIHSAPDLHAAMNVALHHMGRTDLSLERVISFIGNGVEKLVERSLKHTGTCTPQDQAAALGAFMHSYEQNMTTLTRTYPGVEKCLQTLRENNVALGICTNKPQGPAREICDDLGLTQYFDDITGAVADVAKKPDPTSLMACISALGADVTSVLYIGDSGVDYHTAQNASVAFRLFGQGYLNVELPDLARDHVFDDWQSVDLLGMLQDS